MKIYWWILFLFFGTCFADPFHAEENRKVEPAPTHLQNQPFNLPRCMTISPENMQVTEIFSELKLVGLIKIDEVYQALMVDKANRLIPLKVGDYFPLENIQISQINLKTLSYIDWQNSENCQQPMILHKKL